MRRPDAAGTLSARAIVTVSMENSALLDRVRRFSVALLGACRACGSLARFEAPGCRVQVHAPVTTLA